ncbi:hypothetical protein CQW23_32082 [Capsicum baccatum]|uniref:MBD domain-containing protein n=1 Tax=Capsicum baccatum TaxID=33114 RepID=A0A2G2V5P1_CAPBA|nr:hypothetical protein CQW23_32082 [Capsicum baccatum]
MLSSMTSPAAAGTITPVTGGDDGIPPDSLLQSETYISETNARFKTAKPSKADFVVEEGKEVDLATPVSVESESKMEVQMTKSVAETVTPVHKYYYDPFCGTKFQSKTEVLDFLVTGSKHKDNTGGDATVLFLLQPSETRSSKKQKKCSSEKGKEKITYSYFDAANPPVCVCWVQTDSCADTWTPFIDGGMVPEGERQEWDAVFSAVPQRNSNEEAGSSNVQ